MRIAPFGAAVIAAFSLFGAVAALAQDVVLTSHDGAIELEGSLRGYDGEFYRIESQYGPLTVDAQGVTCSGPGCPDLERYVAEVRIAGAPAIGEVLFPALLEQFGRSRGYWLQRVVKSDLAFALVLQDRAEGRTVARFDFALGSSDQGFAALIADEADLSLSLREATSAEIAAGRSGGIGDLSADRRVRVLALDALIPVVAPDSPLNELPVAKMAGIVGGALTNWAEIDPKLEPMGPVALVTGQQSDGAELRVLAGWVGGGEARAALKHAPGNVADAVARDASAIGFARYSDTGTARPLAMRGACGILIDGSADAIRAEDYPLALPLYLYTPARRLPLMAREFLDWLQTPAAQQVVQRAGFVDQQPREVPIAAQGSRLRGAILNAGPDVSLGDLQALTRGLEGARRMTLSFRFRSGATRLDAHSLGNIDRIARDIEAGLYDGQELILVGFSDGEGPAAGNLRIAQQRAQTVERLLREAAQHADFAALSITAEAYGEALPLACDDTEWGRRVNRRVELWVR